MNVKAAQETVRQAEALVSEAKNDNGNAQQALEKAYDAKAEAETADADAKQALAEAETAFANAKAALAEAEKLAGLAREAAVTFGKPLKLHDPAVQGSGTAAPMRDTRRTVFCGASSLSI